MGVFTARDKASPEFLARNARSIPSSRYEGAEASRREDQAARVVAERCTKPQAGAALQGSPSPICYECAPSPVLR